jgi:hypothetical protein
MALPTRGEPTELPELTFHLLHDCTIKTRYIA